MTNKGANHLRTCTIITGSLYNSVGGPYHSVRSSALAFAASGYQVKVIGTRDKSSQSRDAKGYINHPMIVCIAQRKFGPYNFHFTLDLPSMYRAIKGSDFVSIQGVWMINCLMAACIAVYCKVPFYVSIRGEFNNEMNIRSAQKQLILPIVRWMFARAAFLQVLNAREVDSLKAIGIKDRVELIGNGIEPKRETACNHLNKTIVFLGRIHPNKGVVDLIDGWKKADLDGWSLKIAGDGDSSFVSEVERSIESVQSIEFLGRVEGEEKEQLLQEATWFILPSAMEGMPMAVLEALSFGVPVLITTECNLIEVFERGAGIRIEKSESSISEQLMFVSTLNSSDYTKFAFSARALAESDFKWSSVVDRLVKSLEKWKH